VLADEGTCTGTYSTTDGSADSRVTSNLTYDSTKSSTTDSTDSGSFSKIITSTHHDTGAQGDGHYFKTFHDLSRF
jgi:predicted nucleic acid binding AN1-type Zn finger protein